MLNLEMGGRWHIKADERKEATIKINRWVDRAEILRSETGKMERTRERTMNKVK